MYWSEIFSRWQPSVFQESVSKNRINRRGFRGSANTCVGEQKDNYLLERVVQENCINFILHRRCLRTLTQFLYKNISNFPIETKSIRTNSIFPVERTDQTYVSLFNNCLVGCFRIRRRNNDVVTCTEIPERTYSIIELLQTLKWHCKIKLNRIVELRCVVILYVY